MGEGPIDEMLESEAKAELVSLRAANYVLLHTLIGVRFQLSTIEGRTKGDRLRLADQRAVIGAAIAKATGAS